MKSFLNLIRWKNLLIVVLTMVLMRYAVIEPIISRIFVVLANSDGSAVPMTLQFPWYDFIILVAATILITAGGYVINDYFDIRTDLINRGEVIVGTSIPRRKAMMYHNILNVAGVAAGFYISWKAGYFWFGTLFLVVSGLLYFYSASYKKQFLLGNLVVSVLTGLVPLLVVLFEWPALYRFYAVNAVSPPELKIIFYWVGGFALFAFLTNFTREIIKDIEDFEGDMAYGRNTIPVVTGITTARALSVCMVVITLVLLYLVWYYFLHDIVTVAYISCAIAVPLLYVAWLLASGAKDRQLHKASTTMKIVMLTGILYSVIVKVILTWTNVI